MSAAVDIGTAPAMDLTGVSKRFDATQALDDVSLTSTRGRPTLCWARTAPASRR